jgi:ubiquinone/menaquinone biosynthesis C-methylase UbiE
MRLVDWGLGHYERTAEELAPVSEFVVGEAQVQRGQRVLDIGCGTGNATVLAAKAGAEVTGIDPARRLLDVARERLDAAGLGASLVRGEAGDLPFADGAFDVGLSVFGIIFAPDPERALAEALRVLRPGGELLLTAWIPEGPIDAFVGVMARAVAEATGQARKRFPWHNEDAVRELAEPHHATVRSTRSELEISASSPEEYLAAGEANHPMSIAMRPVLERAGTSEEVRKRALDVLREGNEAPEGFRVTGPYRLVRVRRD